MEKVDYFQLLPVVETAMLDLLLDSLLFIM